MKRIEFIAPVEAMRGNLSGSQDLNYGTNNGSAYEQEVGKQTAANNYDPRFVGAKRGRDGLKYFQVRTKNTIGLTVKSKTAMALLAGSSACYVAASKNISILTRLQVAFDAAKASDASLTFRKWLQGLMFEMLALKQETITITSSVGNATINNPWVMDGDGETNLTISSKNLIKFANILADPKPVPVYLGQFGRVLLRWDGANPTYRNSSLWSTKNIPEAFNPDFQGPYNGHHYILQAELMEGYMMLQEKDGDTLVASWKIMDGETPVSMNANVIAGHNYVLEPIG